MLTFYYNFRFYQQTANDHQIPKYEKSEIPPEKKAKKPH